MAKNMVGLVQRHGDTNTNDKDQFRSRLDPTLNAEGIEQAEKSAKNIASKYKGWVKKIVTSPMLRAVQTAEIINEKLDVPLTESRGLFPWNLGFMSGKTKEDYQEILDYFIDNPASTIPDGESLNNMEKRIEEFFDPALREEGTLYVTHTSDIVTLENFLEGDGKGRPESSEPSVEVGGLLAVYEEDGKYSFEVVFGNEEDAEYGS